MWTFIEFCEFFSGLFSGIRGNINDTDVKDAHHASNLAVAKCCSTCVVLRMPLARSQSARRPENCSTTAIARYGTADIKPVFSSLKCSTSAQRNVKISPAMLYDTCLGKQGTDFFVRFFVVKAR